MSIGKVLIQVCSLVFDPYWKCVPILSQKKTQRLLHCISTVPKDFWVGKKPFLKVSCGLIKPANFPTWGILWPFCFCHQTFPSVRDDSSSTTFCVQQIPSTQTPRRHNLFHLCWRAKGCDSLPKESRFVVHLPLLQVVTSADENNKTTKNNFHKECHCFVPSVLGTRLCFEPCSKPRRFWLLWFRWMQQSEQQPSPRWGDRWADERRSRSAGHTGEWCHWSCRTPRQPCSR